MLSRSQVFALTTLAMIAFAGNSLLCRAALRDTSIDAATFTFIRIGAGAIALSLIVRARVGLTAVGGSWLSGAALFAYAALFSFSYLSLSAGTGALLLFGAVQATMIGYGLARGERMSARQVFGLVLAAAGLVVLLLPGLAAPPLLGAAFMIGAGIAWGIYSLRGKGAGDPTQVTAGNFVRALVFSAILSVAAFPWMSIDGVGALYAIASGALSSGVGYAIWYTALRGLRATAAATVQLSVPAIAALGGIALLGEPMTLRFLLASAAILGGIAFVVVRR